MSNLKTIIEATLAQKPLAVKETIDEIMAVKCRAIVDNIQPEFGNAVMEEQEEAAEMQNFFEAFHADHGDKPIEEQLEIMEAFEEETVEMQNFFEAFYADHGYKTIEEQFEIMEAFEEELAEKKHVKPDFLDLDVDGNKKEPMEKAAKDKEANKSKVISELSPETRARYAGAAARNIADLADKRSEANAELYRSTKMGQRVSDPKKQQELSNEAWKKRKESGEYSNKIKRRQDGLVRAVKGKE